MVLLENSLRSPLQDWLARDGLKGTSILFRTYERMSTATNRRDRKVEIEDWYSSTFRLLGENPSEEGRHQPYEGGGGLVFFAHGDYYLS